jgi:hypothetical protein
MLRNASAKGVDGNGSDQSLRNYAATYVLKHMLEIHPDKAMEGMEVMEELGWILSNRYDFATDLESSKVNLSELFSGRLFQHVGSWMRWHSSLTDAENLYNSKSYIDKLKKEKGGGKDGEENEGEVQEEETGVQMEVSLSLNITSWWKFVKDAPRSRLLFNLAKAYLQRLYSSRDRISALASYRGAIFFFGMVSYFVRPPLPGRTCFI